MTLIVTENLRLYIPLYPILLGGKSILPLCILDETNVKVILTNTGYVKVNY